MTSLLTDVISFVIIVAFTLFFVFIFSGTFSIKGKHPSLPSKYVAVLWFIRATPTSTRNITFCFTFFSQNHFSSMWIVLWKQANFKQGKLIWLTQNDILSFFRFSFNNGFTWLTTFFYQTFLYCMMYGTYGYVQLVGQDTDVSPFWHINFCKFFV